jgi:hypothetical protein
MFKCYKNGWIVLHCKWLQVLWQSHHILTYFRNFEIVFAPLKRYLIDLSLMEMWTSKSAGGALTSDLPTFSLSPQEYITKIGQYMMTLPQHLEPFTMQDNPAVLVALKHGRLPYTDETDNHQVMLSEVLQYY